LAYACRARRWHDRKHAQRRPRRQPRSGDHAWEAPNLRASKCCAYASRFGPDRCVKGKTRRPSPPGHRPQSETSGRFGRDASIYLRPHAVAR
jgi:hypothetical protein